MGSNRLVWWLGGWVVMVGVVVGHAGHVILRSFRVVCVGNAGFDY